MRDPKTIGLRGPRRCNNFSPTLMNATMAIAYPRVSSPAPCALIAPPDVLRHQATEECGEPRAAPRTHGPQTDGALAPFSIPIGFHQRQARRHDAGAREPLADAADEQGGGRQRPRTAPDRRGGSRR